MATSRNRPRAGSGKPSDRRPYGRSGPAGAKNEKTVLPQAWLGDGMERQMVISLYLSSVRNGGGEMKTYTNREELKKSVVSALDSAEKGGRARLLRRDSIDALVERVATRAWGYASGDGGHVARAYCAAADTTYFTLAWYSWRGEKHLYISAYRGRAKSVPYGQSGYFSLDGSMDDAYRCALPQRHKRCREIQTQRRISSLTRHLPACPVELRDVREDIGGLVVGDCLDRAVIGTPAGWIETRDRYRDNRSAWLLLSDLGFPVPRLKKDRVWNDEMTALVALHILGR